MPEAEPELPYEGAKELLLEDGCLIGSVALKGEELDDLLVLPDNFPQRQRKRMCEEKLDELVC